MRRFKLSSLIFLFLILTSFSSSAQVLTSTTLEKSTEQIHKKNDPKHLDKPYVVIVSIDGFRFDYVEKYGATTLQDIAKNGRRAESMMPSFPSKTFPNHYSIITGMYPGHHGLIDNNFYDPVSKKNYSMGDVFAVREGSWYGGDPIWVLAEKSGMVSASFFWVGSEAKIQGITPTYFFNYDPKKPNEERVAQVLKWLELPIEERPHFITVYFSDVDMTGHEFGPESEQVGNAVKSVDEQIQKLRDGLKKTGLPINLFVVSDHGMAALDAEKTIELSQVIDMQKFEVGGGGAVTNLYSSDKALLNKAYTKLKETPHLNVYKKTQAPKEFHASKSKRFGDLIVVADIPWYVMTKPIKDKKKPANQLASHGWNPKEKEMHGIFFAEGPNIQPGERLPTFENVNVYPLILKILGLKSPKKIDGRPEVLAPIYREQQKN